MADASTKHRERQRSWRSRFANDKSRRQLLFVGGICCLLVSLVIVNQFGFGDMAARSNPAPERLRDFTFPVWQHESWLDHGFLSFLKAGDFRAGIAYTNHSTGYLFLMYLLYQLERVSASLDMRTTAAYLEMAATVGVVAVVVWRRTRIRLQSIDAILALLGIVYLVTEPGYWISAGKFNVDNPIHFSFPLFVLASYQLAYRRERDGWFWATLLLLSVLAPQVAILLALFMCVKMLANPQSRRALARPSVVMFGVGALFYLQPPVVAKMLGFSTENSGWLFRSGLDGDRSYYSNPVTAVIHPFVDRPFTLIVVPAALLVGQLVYAWRSNGRVPIPANADDSTFLQFLFSQYIISLLFWPQAISVHPYLYDYLLVGPVLVWVILNFASGVKFSKHFSFWSLLMVGLITFNLTQIAQAAHCAGCVYPP
jgi:hypothetical protein